MGGQLTVSSQEHHGSIFTFILPYRVSPICDSSDDPDELSDMVDHDATDMNDDDMTTGFFQFQPRTLGSLFSSNGSTRTQLLAPNSLGLNPLHRINGFSEVSYSFPTNSEDACSVSGAAEAPQESESSSRPCPENDYNKNAIGEDKHNHCMSDAGDIKEIRHPQDPSQMQANSDYSPEGPKAKMKSKILLVEDNKINVMVTRSMMKQLGHEIDVVNNGAEAVRAVQCGNYSLVLMVSYKNPSDFLYTSQITTPAF